MCWQGIPPIWDGMKDEHNELTLQLESDIAEYNRRKNSATVEMIMDNIIRVHEGSTIKSKN
jgi:uncharacterized protein YccT (UPF0319 family)